MVDMLAARLKADPNDALGWVRLMRAYTVLGETEKAKEALVDGAQDLCRQCRRPDRLQHRAAKALSYHNSIDGARQTGILRLGIRATPPAPFFVVARQHAHALVIALLHGRAMACRCPAT